MTLHARKKEIRKLMREVNLVLWRDWDPFGCGVPEDEYESYAPVVARLLTEDAPAGEIAAYLRDTAAEWMTTSVSEAKLADVVAKLLALRGGEGEAR